MTIKTQFSESFKLLVYNFSVYYLIQLHFSWVPLPKLQSPSGTTCCFVPPWYNLNRYSEKFYPFFPSSFFLWFMIEIFLMPTISPFKVGWLLPKGKNVEKHTEVFPSIEFFFRLFISYQFEISFAVSILFHCHRLIERIKDIRTTAVCVCIHWGITSYKEWQGNVNFFPTLHFSFAIIFYYENILLWCCYLCIEWICRDNVDEMRIYSMLRWQANGNG